MNGKPHCAAEMGAGSKPAPINRKTFLRKENFMPVENSQSQNHESQPEANSAPASSQHELETPRGERLEQPTIPPEVQKLFGDPPILIGEDPAHYNCLLDQWVIAIAPQDIAEWLWLKDCVDESWEILRLPRFKSALISLGRGNAIYEIMREVIGRGLPEQKGHAERLASEWFTDPKAKDQVIGVLATQGLTEVSIDARALSSCVNRYTRIDMLRSGAMARRNVALREIERRRAEIVQSPERTSKATDETADEAGVASSDGRKSSPTSQ